MFAAQTSMPGKARAQASGASGMLHATVNMDPRSVRTVLHLVRRYKLNCNRRNSFGGNSVAALVT